MPLGTPSCSQPRPDRPTSEDGDRPAAPLWPSRYLVFFGLVILGCAADLSTKGWVFRELGPPPGPTRWIWEGVVGLQTSLNEGALFGMGQGMVWGFAALSAAAAVGIVWWLFVAGAARNLLLCVALGCVTAGILGNLYDRLGLHQLRWEFAGPLHAAGDPAHAVRDWILVMIGNRPWPNFNVADSLLVSGAILLVWHAFRHDTAKASSAPRK